MSLKKNGFPLRNTEQGSVTLVAGLWFLLFLCILFCSGYQIQLYRCTSSYLEDAQAASNLAALVIDVEEYGISHTILLEDPQGAYRRFREALQVNLGLDGEFQCANKGLITSPVRIERVVVYQVRQDMVEVFSFEENGVCHRWEQGLEKAVAPNGEKIVNSGIYSEISCTVRGLFDQEIQARKQNLADVTGR